MVPNLLYGTKKGEWPCGGCSIEQAVVDFTQLPQVDDNVQLD